MIINLPTKRIEVMSQWQTFLSVLPTRWRRKPARIDTDRNYVTVTSCIGNESVPKVTINNNKYIFLKLPSAFW